MRRCLACLTVSLQLIESHAVIMHGLSPHTKVSRRKKWPWVSHSNDAETSYLPHGGNREELEILSSTLHHLVMFSKALQLVCAV